MRLVIILILLTWFSSCTERVETLLPDGTTETFSVTTIVDNSKEKVQLYADSEMKFFEKKQYLRNGDEISECFWYYKSGSPMDFKYYINDNLYFYSRYDPDGNIIQTNGVPETVFGDQTDTLLIDPEIPYTRRILTFKIPNAFVKFWISDDLNTTAKKQIKLNARLKECKIEGDSTGYIFKVDSNSVKTVPLLWSIEQTNGKVIKSGLIVDKYSSIEK